MGAQAAIIIEEEGIGELEGEIEELIEEEELYDGTGKSVYIPTLLINKQDGQAIMDLFSSDPAV